MTSAQRQKAHEGDNNNLDQQTKPKAQRGGTPTPRSPDQLLFEADDDQETAGRQQRHSTVDMPAPRRSTRPEATQAKDEAKTVRKVDLTKTIPDNTHPH